MIQHLSNSISWYQTYRQTESFTKCVSIQGYMYISLFISFILNVFMISYHTTDGPVFLFLYDFMIYNYNFMISYHTTDGQVFLS